VAMVWLAAQPADEGALQVIGIKPVCLRPSMLARDSDARRMDDIGFDVARSQPARQPEASRPVSKATAMRVIVRPAFVASSRQRCNSRSSASASNATKIALNSPLRRSISCATRFPGIGPKYAIRSPTTFVSFRQRIFGSWGEPGIPSPAGRCYLQRSWPVRFTWRNVRAGKTGRTSVTSFR
jgi:hypothetical protein